MLSGSLINNACFDSPALAQDAYFSAVPVAVFPDSMNSMVRQVVKYEYVNGAWMRSVYSETPVSSSLLSQSLAVSPNFAPCANSTDSYFFGAEVASAIVGSMLIAWGFNLVRKVLV